jgi:hypothetical protein
MSHLTAFGIFNKPLCPLLGDVTLGRLGMTPLKLGPGFLLVMLSLPAHGGMQILHLVIEFGVAESRRLGVSCWA